MSAATKAPASGRRVRRRRRWRPARVGAAPMEGKARSLTERRPKSATDDTTIVRPSLRLAARRLAAAGRSGSFRAAIAGVFLGEIDDALGVLLEDEMRPCEEGLGGDHVELRLLIGDGQR